MCMFQNSPGGGKRFDYNETKAEKVRGGCFPLQDRNDEAELRRINN